MDFPLFVAANLGHNEGVRLLLADRRVEVNYRNEQNLTALDTAVAEGNIEVVRLLLGSDEVDVNNKNVNNATVLHYAADEDYHEILEILLADPRLNSFNWPDNEGETPVMTALVNNSSKCLRKLLAHPSVNLDTTDREGKGLLEVAR